jgi:hypothetical protein
VVLIQKLCLHSINDSHIVDPLRSTIILVLRAEWTNIVRLPIIIPSDNLDVLSTQSQYLVPAVEPESITGEDPAEESYKWNSHNHIGDLPIL